jgi:RNA polymerase-binding transcription factor DksA
MSTSDFKTRLLDEKSQLEEKIDKLDAFTKSEQFKTVDKFQADMLTIQLPIMRSYAFILKARIDVLN